VIVSPVPNRTTVDITKVVSKIFNAMSIIQKNSELLFSSFFFKVKQYNSRFNTSLAMGGFHLMVLFANLITRCTY